MAESEEERRRLPPIAWFMILVLGFCVAGFLVATVFFQVPKALSSKEAFLLIVQSATLSSVFIIYLNRGPDLRRDVPVEVRQRMTEKSIQASQSGIPWYIAPVLWIPISMLSLIWYFSS